jgi:tRNA(Arg) A34 adenosine deaminase TadA
LPKRATGQQRIAIYTASTKERKVTANLTATDITHLHHATELAKAAAQRSNRPFGAVIVDRDGKPLAEAENSVLTDDDIAAHAEMNAIRIACRAGLQRQLAGATMYASGEPCPMCTGAILRFGIRRVVYGSSWDTMLPALGNQPPTVHVASRDIAALSPQEMAVIGPCESAL